MSHEIKNPLMIMRASAESLKKESNKPEADFILEEVDRLNQIVSGYLDFASGKLLLKTEKTDIAALISDIISKFSPQFQEKNISLKSDIEKSGNENILVTADPIALRQVFINLILNASEAVTECNHPEILIIVRPETDRVNIAVSDNGPGINPKELKNIFEPFYTTKTKGSGLGLFHTRKLIEAMGGMINIKQENKKRTKFVLSLPTADKDK